LRRVACGNCSRRMRRLVSLAPGLPCPGSGDFGDWSSSRRRSKGPDMAGQRGVPPPIMTTTRHSFLRCNEIRWHRCRARPAVWRAACLFRAAAVPTPSMTNWFAAPGYLPLSGIACAHPWHRLRSVLCRFGIRTVGGDTHRPPIKNSHPVPVPGDSRTTLVTWSASRPKTPKYRHPSP